MIPEQQHQPYQAPSSPITQQQQPHQPHTSINSIINPPQPEYDTSYPSAQNNVPQLNVSHSPAVNVTGGAGVSQEKKPEEQRQATVRSTKGKYTLSDFIIQRTLGTGSFGRVHLVQSRHNLRFYAIKVLKKTQVVKMKQVEHTNDERKMLQKVKHPFLITLWGTFQDTKNLYMVMDFIEGGELFSLLRKSQVISPRWP